MTASVDPVNDAPVVAAQSVSLPENTSRLIVLQGSDLETSVLDLTFSIASGPSHGSLVQESPNTWRYTPDTDYVGDDNFTFTATDQGDPDGTPANALTSVSATVSISVTAANQAPGIAAIDDQAVTEGSAVSFVVSADDPDGGDTLQFSLDAGPTGAAIDPDTGLFYWYAGDGPQAVDVTVRVRDDGSPSLSDTRTFTLTVDNVPPLVTISGLDSIKEGELYNLDLAAVDPGEDTIASWSINWGDSAGPEVLPGDTTSTTHVYASPGSYIISATAEDEDGSFAAQPPIELTVRPFNSPPEALDDTYAVDEDGLLTVALPGVLANDTDVDGQPLTAVLVSGPGSGTLDLNVDGSFDYTPDADFFGTDTFTYVANDGTFDSGDATVTITVNPVNDAPTDIALDHATVDENVSGAVIGTLTVTDPDV